jgi:hypothetical protein
VTDETYNRVGSRLWLERWSDDVRLVALYLLTCKHRPTEGIYHLPEAYAATDLRWPCKRYAKAFRALVEDGFVEWDAEAEVVLIVNALKWQAPANPNQMKGAVKKLKLLPSTTLTKRFAQQVRIHAPALADHIEKHNPEVFANA